jgi:hypothetical protein
MKRPPVVDLAVARAKQRPPDATLTLDIRRQDDGTIVWSGEVTARDCFRNPWVYAQIVKAARDYSASLMRKVGQADLAPVARRRHRVRARR